MRAVHLLNWKLKTIEEILPDIHRQGFDTIQINPMQELKHSEHFHWWISYQPLGFFLGNMFGTKEDLTKLCSTSKDKYGIDIIVDAICNHTANLSDTECLVPHTTVNPLLRDNDDCWKKPRVKLTYGGDRKKAVTELIGLPGLDLNNEIVRKMVFAYLTELKECGVSGFRFDAAKHIGLPNDGVSFFQEIKEFLAEEGLYAYGEFLGGTKEWRDEFTAYMDILTGYNVDVTDPIKHVAFTESHDTYLNEDGHSTKNITIHQINGLYSLLTSVYPKTLHYVRAIKHPYLPGEENSDFSIKTTDERNCFDMTFLESKEIRKSNEKQLIKKYN